MKQIWAGTKFIWQRRQFPPNEFYVQFRSKGGKLKLYEPKPEDLIIKQKAGILNRGGGQKVQRKATGIEMRHLPTNTVVHCQDKRTPEENKERAMLWMRYLLDKQYNPDGLAAQYEASLPALEEKLKQEKQKSVQTGLERINNELVEERRNFKMESHHVIELDGKLTHVISNISVDADDPNAYEALRAKVAEKTIY